MTTDTSDAPQDHETPRPAIRISAAERRILVEALLKEFATLAAAYSKATARGEKRRLSTEIRAFGSLLNKLQGSFGADLEAE